MKKYLVGILALFMALVFSVNAFATATVTASIVAEDPPSQGSGNRNYHVAVVCTMGADADNPAIVSLTGKASGSTALLTATEARKISGAFLMSITTIPGAGTTAPGAAHTVVFKDEDGAALPITVTTTSTTATEVFFPTAMFPLRDVQIDFPDLGDAADTETLILKFYK